MFCLLKREKWWRFFLLNNKHGHDDDGVVVVVVAVSDYYTVGFYFSALTAASSLSCVCTQQYINAQWQAGRQVDGIKKKWYAEREYPPFPYSHLLLSSYYVQCVYMYACTVSSFRIGRHCHLRFFFFSGSPSACLSDRHYKAKLMERQIVWGPGPVHSTVQVPKVLDTRGR